MLFQITFQNVHTLITVTTMKVVYLYPNSYYIEKTLWERNVDLKRMFNFNF